MKIYGIKSCDTCRKARKWLDEQGIDHQWIDLREDGFDENDLDRWLSARGPDALVNRRSTTWRQLPEGERPAMEAAAVRPVLIAHPTLIKRPVIEHAGTVQVGFTAGVREGLVST